MMMRHGRKVRQVQKPQSTQSMSRRQALTNMFTRHVNKLMTLLRTAFPMLPTIGWAQNWMHIIQSTVDLYDAWGDKNIPFTALIAHFAKNTALPILSNELSAALGASVWSALAPSLGLAMAAPPVLFGFSGVTAFLLLLVGLRVIAPKVFSVITPKDVKYIDEVLQKARKTSVISRTVHMFDPVPYTEEERTFMMKELQKLSDNHPLKGMLVRGVYNYGGLLTSIGSTILMGKMGVGHIQSLSEEDLMQTGIRWTMLMLQTTMGMVVDRWGNTLTQVVCGAADRAFDRIRVHIGLITEQELTDGSFVRKMKERYGENYPGRQKIRQLLMAGGGTFGHRVADEDVMLWRGWFRMKYVFHWALTQVLPCMVQTLMMGVQLAAQRGVTEVAGQLHQYGQDQYANQKFADTLAYLKPRLGVDTVPHQVLTQYNSLQSQYGVRTTNLLLMQMLPKAGATPHELYEATRQVDAQGQALKKEWNAKVNKSFHRTELSDQPTVDELQTFYEANMKQRYELETLLKSGQGNLVAQASTPAYQMALKFMRNQKYASEADTDRMANILGQYIDEDLRTYGPVLTQTNYDANTSVRQARLGCEKDYRQWLRKDYHLTYSGKAMGLILNSEPLDVHIPASLFQDRLQQWKETTREARQVVSQVDIDFILGSATTLEEAVTAVREKMNANKMQNYATEMQEYKEQDMETRLENLRQEHPELAALVTPKDYGVANFDRLFEQEERGTGIARDFITRYERLEKVRPDLLQKAGVIARDYTTINRDRLMEAEKQFRYESEMDEYKRNDFWKRMMHIQNNHVGDRTALDRVDVNNHIYTKENFERLFELEEEQKARLVEIMLNANKSNDEIQRGVLCAMEFNQHREKHLMALQRELHDGKPDFMIPSFRSYKPGDLNDDAVFDREMRNILEKGLGDTIKGSMRPYKSLLLLHGVEHSRAMLASVLKEERYQRAKGMLDQKGGNLLGEGPEQRMTMLEMQLVTEALKKKDASLQDQIAHMETMGRQSLHDRLYESARNHIMDDIEDPDQNTFRPLGPQAAGYAARRGKEFLADRLPDLVLPGSGAYASMATTAKSILDTVQSVEDARTLYGYLDLLPQNVRHEVEDKMTDMIGDVVATPLTASANAIRPDENDSGALSYVQSGIASAMDMFGYGTSRIAKGFATMGFAGNKLTNMVDETLGVRKTLVTVEDGLEHLDVGYGKANQEYMQYYSMNPKQVQAFLLSQIIPSLSGQTEGIGQRVMWGSAGHRGYVKGVGGISLPPLARDPMRLQEL
jgi:hypothetical protein